MKFYRIATTYSDGQVCLTKWYPWSSAVLILGELNQLGHKIVRIEEKFVEV